MQSFRRDPYLWIHLAGLAALPLFLELCVVGLAIGKPLFPLWFELLFVGGIGILPILWMQWQRPFSIFSVVFLAVKPKQLTDDQRRILHLFKTPLNRGLALITAIGMAGVLWELYTIAPLTSPPPIAALASATRGTGLVIAAVAFLAANLFLQVPVSVLRVLLTSESQFAATEPYPIEQVARHFTIFGIQINHILPPLQAKSLTPPARPEPISPVAAEAAIAPSSPDTQPSTVEPVVASVPEVQEAMTASELELEEEWEDEEAIEAAEQLIEQPEDQIEDQILELTPDANPEEVIEETPEEVIAEIPEETVIAAEVVIETEAIIEAEVVSEATIANLEEVVDLAEAILIPEHPLVSEAETAKAIWVEVPVENSATWVEAPTVENPIDFEQVQPDAPLENPADVIPAVEPSEPIDIIEDETVETQLPTPPTEA
ncbi:MAG TPA: low-complexity tail membrane protein [Allocoleopsis sp.]